MSKKHCRPKALLPLNLSNLVELKISYHVVFSAHSEFWHQVRSQRPLRSNFSTICSFFSWNKTQAAVVRFVGKILSDGFGQNFDRQTIVLFGSKTDKKYLRCYEMPLEQWLDIWTIKTPLALVKDSSTCSTIEMLCCHVVINNPIQMDKWRLWLVQSSLELKVTSSNPGKNKLFLGGLGEASGRPRMEAWGTLFVECAEWC